MSQLKDKEYKRFEEIKHITNDGSEFWSARKLAPALEYNKWENFHKVILNSRVYVVTTPDNRRALATHIVG